MLASLAVSGACGAEQENLAKGCPCKTFSSREEHGWSASKLTDGETGGVGWSSRAFAGCADHSLYPEYVVADLGRSCRIRGVVLHPAGDGEQRGVGFPEDFTIQACHEGEPWRVVVEERGYPLPKHGGPRTFVFESTEGRYLKVEATRLREAEPGKYCCQLSEIEVFGEQAEAPDFEDSTVLAQAPPEVIRLRCENRDNPVGLDAANPRLSWWMQSPGRGERQTAWRVLVASSKELLSQDRGDLWDSGKTAGDQSIAVRYAGRTLQSGRRYYWKVMLWDRHGVETGWSDPASFQMGKMRQDEWQGAWITADDSAEPGPSETAHGGASIHTTEKPGHRPVYLRREIKTDRPVERATVHFSGLGFSELTIDGRKVGDYVIGPGFTNYDKRVQYLTFDVTDHFAQGGPKALGVILADGWYGNGYGHGFENNIYVDKPKLLLNLHLEHPDGTETVVASDSRWKWRHGEITCSRITREDIDLREALPGWLQPGFDEDGWRPAVEVDGPGGMLVSRNEEHCRVVQEIRPVSLRYDPTSNTATYEFGREYNGWVRFRTRGPEGTRITITTIPTLPLPRSSRFVLAGTGGEEVYEPRFFYAGMRRVVIEGAACPPALEDLTGCLVSMDWQPSGSFRCSDDLVNWLDDATRRTVVAYTTWLPNDPVREWKAWMQDPQNMLRSSAYLFDSQTMYERWFRDIVDGQRPDGSSPNVTPGAYFDAYNSPWWGGCLVWVPWHWYQYYGDSSLLEECYPAMKRYVDFLGTVASDGAQDWGLADWCPVEETPRPLINTPAYYLYVTVISRTAQMLGIDADARHYAQLAEEIRTAFNNRFLDASTGIYGPEGSSPSPGSPVQPVDGKVPHEIWWTGSRACTQAGQALALALGLAPEEHRSAIEKALLREIAAHHNRVSTGFVSTSYLLTLLGDLAPEVGWAMTTSQQYPSWYSMTAGSDQDLLKETWAGGQALMPSLGGNIVAWHYQALGGIRPDPEGPGFKRILIKPSLVGDLHRVESKYDSVHGRIVSNWRRRDGRLVMDVTIPANTSATVFVPTENAASVTESGKPIGKATGVELVRTESDVVVLAVGSGTYRFLSAIGSKGAAPDPTREERLRD